MAETHLERLPWHDLSPASRTSDVVLVPVGALEPHGRHVPLGTDVFIAAGLADRLASATGGYVYPAMDRWRRSTSFTTSVTRQGRCRFLTTYSSASTPRSGANWCGRGSGASSTSMRTRATPLFSKSPRSKCTVGAVARPACSSGGRRVAR